ncbi:hypothetical protein DY000_02021295 [Brassica cretica]|uniref:Uncharacterized protein n=1 Tax=Brassica cretica TaxID=69181 RepID=A0ABQ7EA68_BRACR|nr:hypothetical protein DY000_02021295 [Brassica cretica]
MPSSTRSNKEIQLFSSDPTSLESSIRKRRRSSSIDNNTSSSLDSHQPPSTQTPVLSIDSRLPPSTEDTLLSTDIFPLKSIDTSEGHLRNAAGQRIYAQVAAIPEFDNDATGTTLPVDEAARPRTLADYNHDDFWQVVKQEKLQEGDFEVESSMSFSGSHWCRSTSDLEHQSTDVNQNRSTAIPEHRSMNLTESTTSCNAVRIMTHEEFSAKHPHPPSLVYVKIDRQNGPTID